MAIRRLHKEYSELLKDPLPGVVATPVSGDMFNWRVVVAGPHGTLYEGGVFRLTMRFPSDYPFKPPKVKITTKIYHPNVSCQGEMCLEILEGHWSPALRAQNVMTQVQELLAKPCADDPYQIEMAHELRNDKEKFEKVAREWVRKYA